MEKIGLKLVNVLLSIAFISFCLIPVFVMLNTIYPERVGISNYFMFISWVFFTATSILSFILVLFLRVKYKIRINGRLLISSIFFLLAISFFSLVIINSIIAMQYGD